MAVIGAGNMLISAVIANNDERVFRQINSDWFVDQDEVELYEFVSSHYRRFNTFPTLTTLAGEGFFIDTADDAPQFYLEQVSDRYIYNLAVEKHAELSSAIDRQDINGVIEASRDMQLSLAGAGINPDILGLQQLSEQVMDRVATARTARGLVGVTTGYPLLDTITTGQLGGNLSLIVASIKLGKTNVLIYMMLQAWFAGHSVMIVSMEMPPQQLAQRILAMIAHINPLCLRSGEVSHFKYLDMQDTIRGFSDMPPIHFIAGDFRKSTSDIYRYASQLQPDLVCVDGAYLVSSKDRNKRTAKHETIGDVANELKADATDLNIPYLATVQFNRTKSRKSGAGFDVNNLGGSHELGMVADLVLGLDFIENQPDKRRLKILAIREGEDNFDAVINFQFDPPDFSYLEPYVEGFGSSTNQGVSFENQFENQENS